MDQTGTIATALTDEDVCAAVDQTPLDYAQAPKAYPEQAPQQNGRNMTMLLAPSKKKAELGEHGEVPGAPAAEASAADAPAAAEG